MNKSVHTVSQINLHEAHRRFCTYTKTPVTYPWHKKADKFFGITGPLSWLDYKNSDQVVVPEKAKRRIEMLMRDDWKTLLKIALIQDEETSMEVTE